MTPMYVPPALYVTWQDHESRAIFVVGRLIKVRVEREEFEYAYTEGSRRAEAAGFKGFVSFPGLDRVHRFDALPPFFSNRVMSPRRPDYPQYINELALNVEDASPFAILSRNGGRRQTDPYEVFPELLANIDGSRLQGWFMLRGVRHLPNAETDIAQLVAEQRLAVVPEPTNPKNPKALQLFGHGSLPFGWVPDYLVDELTHAIDTDPSTAVVVERVNPLPTPYQHRLLCRWSTSATTAPYVDPMREPRSPGAVSLRGLGSTGTEG
jgi:hypothetical protein